MVKRCQETLQASQIKEHFKCDESGETANNDGISIKRHDQMMSNALSDDCAGAALHAVQVLFQKGNKKICARAPANPLSLAETVCRSSIIIDDLVLHANIAGGDRSGECWHLPSRRQTTGFLLSMISLQISQIANIFIIFIIFFFFFSSVPLFKKDAHRNKSAYRHAKATADFQPPRRLMISLELPWGADKVTIHRRSCSESNHLLVLYISFYLITTGLIVLKCFERSFGRLF